MTNLPVENACPNCELLRAELAAVRGELAALQAQVEKLMAQLAAAQKNSANSSKPPSSDIVKPPRSASAQQGKRKRGGQPGHPRHTRPPFEPDEIDHRLDYRITVCPDCGGKTTPLASAPRIVQQVEVIDTPIVVSEHRAHTCFCEHCQKSFAAEIPREVKQSGLCGPRLTAVV